MNNSRRIAVSVSISAGIVIQTKELWEELTQALESLSVRLVFELAEIPSDWTAFLERLDRVRPEVILIETEKLRVPLDEVMRRIRSTEARPSVIALHTTAEPDAILAALRAGVVEYLHPPLLSLSRRLWSAWTADVWSRIQRAGGR